MTLQGEKFTPNEYSNEFITDPSLILIPSNYYGDGWKIDWIYSDYWHGLEFIIITESSEIAQNVLFNVLCSIAVIDGKNSFSNDAHYPHEFGTIENIKGLQLIDKPIRGLTNGSIPNYFKLTVEASKDKRLENAIVKYHLSAEIYSLEYMDLDEIDWKTTKFSYIQMRFAYAIILAYSVLEELELQIIASSDAPSILPNGNWNPEIYNELVERLEKSNINICEHVSWMIRGEKTEIEKKKPIKIVRKAEWADTPGYKDEFFISVNDGYVSLPDAINYISFLRSSIASHGVGKRIMGLSVFDVANAQFLSRRLLLEKIKMWK